MPSTKTIIAKKATASQISSTFFLLFPSCPRHAFKKEYCRATKTRRLFHRCKNFRQSLLFFFSPPVRLQQQNWGGKEGPPMLIGNKNLLTSNLRQKTGALFEVAANRGADDRPTEKETTTVIEGLEDPINPD